MRKTLAGPEFVFFTAEASRTPVRDKRHYNGVQHFDLRFLIWGAEIILLVFKEIILTVPM